MNEIAPADWDAFVDRFTREHDGWPATLQLRENDGGLDLAVDDRPFRGVTLEHRGGRTELILSFGDDADEHLTHLIEQPTALAVETGDEGDCSLVIGLADRSGCILELASPFRID